MNTTKKGSRTENQVRTIWKDLGYKVDFKPKPFYNPADGKYARKRNTDIYGLWDFIALLEDGKTCYVQVKSNITDVSKFKKDSLPFLLTYGASLHSKYLLWLRSNGNYHRVWEWDYYTKSWKEWETFDLMQWKFKNLKRKNINNRRLNE